jgi:zinc transport system ATP-binding protein
VDLLGTPASPESGPRTPPALRFDSVDFGYDGRLVLRGVSLVVPRGAFAAVIGPNGGGKTTLLKLALGLVRPTRGTIEVLGGPPGRAGSRIGYVPQRAQTDPLFPALVEDVVLTGRLRPRGGAYAAADRGAAAAAVERVGLADSLRRPFAVLSGGQRQRALIARALAAEPEMLLLDEPTANLDVAAERVLYDLLASLARALTIVMVSHDLGFVSPIADMVICVKETVAVHPTCELTGADIRETYGRDVLAVRHDQGRGPCGEKD